MIRKSVHKILGIFLGVMMILVQSVPVFAQELSVQVDYPEGFITDPNSKWAVGLSQSNVSGYNFDTYAQISISGKKVYCIEPLSLISDGNGGYTASDLGDYFGDSTLTQKLEYISALGYGFQGDYSHELDFATQIRIWQEIMPGLVVKIHPDIQAKIDQINNRLKIMMTDVSFDQQKVILPGYGKEFAQTLTDTNGVFSHYTLDSGTLSYEQQGDQLTIWMEKSQGKSGQLTMNCFYPQQGVSIAYRSKYNHQAVAYITGGTPNQLHVSAMVETGSVQVLKRDAQTQDISQGDATLAGAQYQLIDNKTKKVAGTFLIQEDLSSNRISDLPTDRTYTIQEIQAPEGYQLDTNQVQIDFSNQKDVILELSDEVITGRIQIKKIITDKDISQIVKPEKGAEFTIVLKRYVDQYGSITKAIEHRDQFSDSEWDILTTDDQGYALSKALAYGTYMAQQTGGDPETHWLKEPFTFEIDQETDEPLEYTINNRPFEYYLRLIKIDAQTKKPISTSGASFQILDEEGKPVTMRVGSKTYDTFQTASNHPKEKEGVFVAQDEKGVLTTPLKLKAGTYQIQEVESPQGYQLLKEPVKIVLGSSYVSQVDDQGHATIEVTIENERPKAKIILHKEFEEGLSEDVCKGEVRFRLSAKEDIFDPADGTLLYPRGSWIETSEHPDGIYSLEVGSLVIDDLVLGSYQLKEIETIEGYQLLEDPIDFEFVQGSQSRDEYVLEKSITNKRVQIQTTVNKEKEWYPEEEIEVTDRVEYLGLVPGKTYRLEGRIIDPKTKKPLQSEGKELIQVLDFVPETKNGFVDMVFRFDASQIEPASYVITERLYCEKGHLLAVHEDLNDDKQTFEILPLYDLQVQKVDADTGKPIQNAQLEFALFKDKEANTLYQTGQTDISKGTVSWKDLKQGSWYLKEVKAPEGYRLLDHVYFLEVKKDGIYIDGKKAKTKEGYFYFEIQNIKIPMVSTRVDWNVDGYGMWFVFSGILLGLIVVIQVFRKI